MTDRQQRGIRVFMTLFALVVLACAGCNWYGPFRQRFGSSTAIRQPGQSRADLEKEEAREPD